MENGDDVTMGDDNRFEKDINIAKGTIKMSGHHKKEPISRNFGSMEEMAKSMEETYQIGKQRENRTEMDAGFDVRSKESVMKFDIGYVPRNGGIVIKEIPKDIIPEEDGLTIIDLADETKKYWVVAVGHLVHDIKKGDVTHIRADAGWIKRTFKKIQFYEGDGFGISGIFMAEEEMKKRIAEHDAEINRRNNMLGGIVLTSAKEKKDEDKSKEELEEDLEQARQEARKITRKASERKEAEEDEKLPDKKEE